MGSHPESEYKLATTYIKIFISFLFDFSLWSYVFGEQIDTDQIGAVIANDIRPSQNKRLAAMSNNIFISVKLE